MKIYDQAAKAVPNYEKLGMYEIYIARAAEIFGVPKTREIYEQAIESGLPDKDVKTMCLKYAELEKSLGEIGRARGIYVFASQFADPHSGADFWDKWQEFEAQHGNEDTFREMLQIRRSVSASYSQVSYHPRTRFWFISSTAAGFLERKPFVLSHDIGAHEVPSAMFGLTLKREDCDEDGALERKRQKRALTPESGLFQL
ncbi:hypothetical protein SCA6_013569 [Theobroma cacao]